MKDKDLNFLQVTALNNNLELFKKAANLAEMNVMDFVLSSAVDRAHQLLDDDSLNYTTQLNLHEQVALVDYLQKRSKPNKAMRDLMASEPFPSTQE